MIVFGLRPSMLRDPDTTILPLRVGADNTQEDGGPDPVDHSAGLTLDVNES